MQGWQRPVSKHLYMPRTASIRSCSRCTALASRDEVRHRWSVHASKCCTCRILQVGQQRLVEYHLQASTGCRVSRTFRRNTACVWLKVLCTCRGGCKSTAKSVVQHLNISGRDPECSANNCRAPEWQDRLHSSLARVQQPACACLFFPQHQPSKSVERSPCSAATHVAFLVVHRQACLLVCATLAASRKPQPYRFTHLPQHVNGACQQARHVPIIQAGVRHQLPPLCTPRPRLNQPSQAEVHQ